MLEAAEDAPDLGGERQQVEPQLRRAERRTADPDNTWRYKIPPTTSIPIEFNVALLPRSDAFSKKLENHCAAVTLYVAHYNFVRRHTTLRTTAPMAAGVESRMWGLDELLAASEYRTSDGASS